MKSSEHSPSYGQDPASTQPRQCRYQVTARDIKRFAQAIGADDPIHYDEDYARSSSFGGIVAPPLFCQSLAYDDVPVEHLDEDGAPVELSAPVPARRVVGGGSDYVIHRLVRPGDLITVTSRTTGIQTRQGRSGLLYLVTVETTFTDQFNLPVAAETATYIKR